MNPSLLSTKDVFSGELTSNTNKTGFGILFQLDVEGRVIVKISSRQSWAAELQTARAAQVIQPAPAPLLQS